MNLTTESGLKIAARISARDKPCILQALFDRKYGPGIADFAFPKAGFSIKQDVLFDTIISQTMPSSINNIPTAGLDGDCVLINTDSSFSIIAFALRLEKALPSSISETSKTAVIEKVLNRLQVINARTSTECILAVANLQSLMQIDKHYLLIIDSISSLFGYLPIKEMTISRSVFFDYLKHTVDTFSIQCLCFRTLTSNQEVNQNSIPYYYHPNLRILFNPEDSQNRTITALISDGSRPAYSCYFRHFSRPQ